MPSLGRAQQPSRQCTTLGTTPERIEEKLLWFPGEKARLLLVAERVERRQKIWDDIAIVLPHTEKRLRPPVVCRDPSDDQHLVINEDQLFVPIKMGSAT
jgi:hypothetical protein